jgi:hypothetical protein
MHVNVCGIDRFDSMTVRLRLMGWLRARPHVAGDIAAQVAAWRWRAEITGARHVLLRRRGRPGACFHAEVAGLQLSLRVNGPAQQ